ncbi:hypothetical protein DVH05_021334 [Phytophthora capsici]|nr:hypothetical protein DVH05_021334 [Phytophthora capsici]
MFMRNIFARAVGHLGDVIPQLVVFNADVFGSLFISYCMQSTPSFWTTLEIMVADAVTMGLALKDIETERVKLIELSRRIDDKLIGNSLQSPSNFTALRDHKLTTLERACNLLEQAQSIKSSSLSSNLELKQESSCTQVQV